MYLTCIMYTMQQCILYLYIHILCNCKAWCVRVLASFNNDPGKASKTANFRILSPESTFSSWYLDVIFLWCHVNGRCAVNPKELFVRAAALATRSTSKSGCLADLAAWFIWQWCGMMWLSGASQKKLPNLCSLIAIGFWARIRWIPSVWIPFGWQLS